MKLGIRQLELLRAVGTHCAVVVIDPLARRLCDLGLMKEARPNSFAHITPDGLRALADAADAGRIELFKLKDWKRGEKGGGE